MSEEVSKQQVAEQGQTLSAGAVSLCVANDLLRRLWMGWGSRNGVRLRRLPRLCLLVILWQLLFVIGSNALSGQLQSSPIFG